MTIQDLIDATPAGDIVNIPPGFYNEQLIIDKPLTLAGPAPHEGNAIIDGSGLANVSTIQILSSQVIVKDLTIQNGPLHGIQAGSDASPNLTEISIVDNKILGHGNAGIITNHHAAMDIDGNTVENNGLSGGFYQVGIILYPHGPTSVTNNRIVSNNGDGIFARESDAGLLIENNVIEDHANSGITLAWDQRNTSIVNNQIKNCGTGVNDEQGGIVLIQSMAEVIEGNTIENCRDSGIFWGWVPTVGTQPTSVMIGDNVISNSSRDAIYLFTQGPGGFISPDLYPLEPTIKDNILSNNTRAGVYVSNLYYYSPGNAKPTINNNRIFANEWGVFNATDQIVDATENWWGSDSGPYQSELNPQGTGNPVSDNVDFIPWLVQPAIPEIIACTIDTVTLENYFFTPLNKELSAADLIVKVTGTATTMTNGEQGDLNFDTWFTQDFIYSTPQGKDFWPTIDHSSQCFAAMIDNEIVITIDLCIIAKLKSRSPLSIPSYGSCSLPGDNNNREIRMECIEVETVHHNCWFRKSLETKIPLSVL